MTDLIAAVLFADVLDEKNAGWGAFAVVIFGAVSKFVYDVWKQYGDNRSLGRKTTIEEYKDLLGMTNKTLADVNKELREEQDGHHDCIRKYEQLSVRMEWVVSELRRHPGSTIPPWVLSGDTAKHQPIGVDLTPTPLPPKVAPPPVGGG